MAQPRRKRILVIDDEEPIRRLLSQVLLKCGFEVITAPDGETGLSLAYTNHPDLLIVDLVMPGLSGQETIEQLKSDQATRAVPVMVLTSESTKENVLKAMAMGASQIVAKLDFQLDAFMKKVLALLSDAAKKEAEAPRPMAQAVERLGLDKAGAPGSSPVLEAAPPGNPKAPALHPGPAAPPHS